ncbi:SH3 domain and tetratricopeptide repeat-containing protein 2 [Lonchura striata]|uniref:SH3 domain and tetratricopeptide repeat-containing protein 2 n=1 Tax=Lonchura striata TaxID=40157 RepID=A0A218UN87_9PASE|nr:SH3 domain and tetratricopeptide repeat-containing protein 2 [Lonchura striata domestica]
MAPAALLCPPSPGKAGLEEQSSPAAEAGHGSPDPSVLLLALRDTFSPELSLSFSVESRSCRCRNSQLQEAARKKLWALESDDRSVCALFKELSARLVCTQAHEDRFLLTFKTLEEVWKFSTYLTLGYVGTCLEQLLLAQEFWLDCALVEDTELRVTVDEEHLATIYMDLLLQEASDSPSAGNFFCRAVPGVCKVEQEGEEGLQLCRNELVHVKSIGQDSKWEGMSLLTGQRGVVPVTALEPIPHPFYQWFLRSYAVSFGLSQEISGTSSRAIVRGRCIATKDHRGAAWDELSFSRGDPIEIIGFFIPGLPWFVGRSLSTRSIGFVPTRHVNPEACEPLGKGFVFLSEEEKSPVLHLPCNGDEQHFATLLGDLAHTDITSVYRLAGFEATAAFPQVPPGEYEERTEGEALVVAFEGFSKPRPTWPWTLPGVGQPQGTFLPDPTVLSLSLPEAALHGSREIQVLQSWEEINDWATSSTSELSSPGSETAPTTLDDVLLEKLDDLDYPKFFIDLNAGHMEDADVFDPILTFLNQDSFVPSFQSFYDLSFSFLHSTFYGFSDEDELVLYLETSRNWAKRTRSVWAHVRLCFLLGKLCIKRVKFSQARVYFEEAMSVLDRGFGDLPLLAALHVSLASIYLKQNMKHKFSSLLGKTVTLLMCLPGRSFSSENELELLTYILRESIAVGNAPLEARVCFLIAKLFLQLGRTEEVLPFLEHLQCLSSAWLSPGTRAGPLDATATLGYLYAKKCLPNIALASVRSFVPSSAKGTPSPIWRAGFILQNASKLLGRQQPDGSSMPALACPYLAQALRFCCEGRAVPMQRTLCAVLCRTCLQHGLLDGAAGYAARAAALGRQLGEEEALESSLALGWVLLLQQRPGAAGDVLRRLLRSLRGAACETPGGAVHNLLAMALAAQGRVQEAAENFLRALHKAKETGSRRNQAVALANLGQLSLSCGAAQLAELYLLWSVRLYAELQSQHELDTELAQVLLWLAQAMLDRQRVGDAKLCYELALGFGLKWQNLRSQLHATERLCHFYSRVCPDLQASITYHEHWASLARQLQDRELEASARQALSQLYQAVGTAEALRQSLDCTKQSLRIFIDLEEAAKAAEAWLQAGKLYYLLQEDELVEMYFQAAIQTALKGDNLTLAMDLYEKAGDTFFNGSRNRAQALEFYRGGAVPLARKLKATQTELRLFNKLAELQISLQGYEKALEFATLAARLSLRVAYDLLHMHEMAEDCYLKTLAMRPPVLQGSAEALYYCKVYWHLGKLALHKLKDEEDAASYFQLALAAAAELGDQELQAQLRAKLGAIPGAPGGPEGTPGCATDRPRWLSQGGSVV